MGIFLMQSKGVDIKRNVLIDDDHHGFLHCFVGGGI